MMTSLLLLIFILVCILSFNFYTNVSWVLIFLLRMRGQISMIIIHHRPLSFCIMTTDLLPSIWELRRFRIQKLCAFLPPTETNLSPKNVEPTASLSPISWEANWGRQLREERDTLPPCFPFTRSFQVAKLQGRTANTQLKKRWKETRRKASKPPFKCERKIVFILSHFLLQRS